MNELADDTLDPRRDFPRGGLFRSGADSRPTVFRRRYLIFQRNL